MELVIPNMGLEQRIMELAQPNLGLEQRVLELEQRGLELEPRGVALEHCIWHWNGGRRIFAQRVLGQNRVMPRSAVASFQSISRAQAFTPGLESAA